MLSKEQSPIFVLGRGIIGLTCAVRLAEAGYAVSIVGPKNTFGTASYAALGLTATKGLVWPRNPFFAAKWRGHRDLRLFIREIEGKVGRTIPIIHDGVYEPCVTPQDYYRVKKRIYDRMFVGAFRVRPPNAISRGYLPGQNGVQRPFLNDAFYYPEDYWFDPPSLLDALELRLDQLRVTKLDVMVTQVTIEADGTLRILGQGFAMPCRTLIVAAGMNLISLIERAFQVRIPHTLLSGGHWKVSAKLDEVFDQLAVITGKTRAVMRSGLISLGSTQTRVPGPSAALPLDEIMKSESILFPQFFYRLSTAFPQAQWDHSTPQFSWGVRVQGKDKLPIFGEFLSRPGSRVILAGGFGKTGFLLAPAAGENMVKLIKNETLSSDFLPFSPGRFGL